MSDFGASFVRFAYLILPVITVVVEVGIGYWIYSRYWDSDKARYFVGVVVTGTLWNVAAFGAVVATSPALQRLFDTAVATFGTLTVVAWVVFTSVYTEEDYHRNRVVQAACVALVGGLVAMVLTNSQLHLLYTDRILVTEPFSYYVYDTAVGGIVALALTSALSVYAYYNLVVYFLSTERDEGRQLVLLLLGALSVAVAQLLGRTGLVPATGFDHSAYGTLPFLVFTSVALFRFRLFDIQPVARSTVVESLQDPMLVIDERRRIVDYNEAATHIWHDLPDRVPTPFAAACPAFAEHIADASGDGHDDTTLPYDGQDRHYSVTVSAVTNDTAGGGNWRAVLLRDVTELEQSRWQLEKQNERLDQVAATISHDLRNPINVATGQLELIELYLDEADIDSETEAKFRDALTEVDGATDRMEAIIDDVLTIAREGKTVEETASLSLASVAREAWSNIETGTATLTISADTTVRAERSKLLTVFENLMRNAVEHGSGVTTVEVGAASDGFFVADDGPGIPKQHRDAVFEYGYSTADDGTGLGLSIVRTMAESHGWTVSLDTDYDDGTRLVFSGVTGFPTAEA